MSTITRLTWSQSLQSPSPTSLPSLCSLYLHTHTTSTYTVEPPMNIMILLYSLLISLLLTNQTQSRTLKRCSSSCGDITINYPFRLDTDPSFCGDSDYQLSCQNNKTLLDFHSGKYYVKRISYDRRIIRLVDVNLADGRCGLPSGSLSVDDVIDDGRYRGRVSNTYTSFVRCDSEIGEVGYRKVDCLSGNGSIVYVSYDNYIISLLQGPCSFISRVPTIYQAVMNPSYQSILLLLQEGFDLGWSVECRDCIKVGFSCTVRSWDPPYEYECYSDDTGLSIPAGILLIFQAIWDLLLGVNLFARFILAPIILIGFLIHKYRTTRKAVDNNENFKLSQPSLTPIRYCYADIVAMTDQFKYKLGQGGSGVVYKGQLPDGSLVAVKMVGDSKLSDEEFVNEVCIIGGIYHVNVIRLLGFCCEGSDRALIFEYMPNGSLDRYIFPKSADIQQQPFSWEKLHRISLGTARGIKYLHEGSDMCIIHFDIKPQNVLLDQNFIPKVSDFSLVKFYPDRDCLSVRIVRGTMGYIAPELISSNLGAASCKSDVYSFGMLLLELVETRWIVDAKGKIPSDVYFPSWAYDHLSEGGNLVLENATENESAIARKLCVVGLWCIQKMGSDRPSMAKVVEMLEGSIVDLQLPPNSLSFPQCTTQKDPQSDSSTELLISETVEKSL